MAAKKLTTVKVDADFLPPLATVVARATHALGGGEMPRSAVLIAAVKVAEEHWDEFLEKLRIVNRERNPLPPAPTED